YKTSFSLYNAYIETNTRKTGVKINKKIPAIIYAYGLKVVIPFRISDKVVGNVVPGYPELCWQTSIIKPITITEAAISTPIRMILPIRISTVSISFFVFLSILYCHPKRLKNHL